MANVLYLDDDEVAITALKGIFKRCAHSLKVVNSADDAWKTLCEDVRYDLFMIEIKLSTGNAWSVIKQIRSNPYLASLPVLVYSSTKDKRVVRSILELEVQNYLFKPFKEIQLLEEIDKLSALDWRIENSSNPQLFFSRIKVAPEDFLEKNTALMDDLKSLNEKLAVMTSSDHFLEYAGKVAAFAEEAEVENFTLLADEMRLILDAGKKNWKKAQAHIEHLHCAIAIQQYRLGLIQAKVDEIEAENAAPEINDKNIEAETFEPAELDPSKLKHSYDEVEERIKEITDYPVIESAAAAFQMMANEGEANLSEVVEMIQRDAGLAAAVLRFSNSSFVAPATVIEDIHQAISVLGFSRVRTLATSLRCVSELSELYKAFRWQDFWTHQVGCAMLSEYIFSELELPGRTEMPYLAGLLCEMGKLLLCEIDPDAYKQAVLDTKQNKVPLIHSEREYFGMSHDQAGLIFAQESNLAPALQAAIAYQHRPAEASDHFELIGSVSIASYLCSVHEVGKGGDIPTAELNSLESHPGWELFSPWLPPSFSTIKFKRTLDSKTKSLKIELGGMAENHLHKKA